MSDFVSTHHAAQAGERRSYDPSFFARLAGLENEHFWFRARNQVISTLVQQITNNWVGGYRVLEVGCGTGNVLRALEEACPTGTVIGMDLFVEGLVFARQRTSCPLVQADLEKPAFAVQFDMIGAFDVIEHITDDVQALRSLHMMLRPGGTLVLTVPAHQSLWSYFDEAAHHCRRYGVDELRQKLIQTGYQIEFLSQFMMSMYSLVWVGRRVAALLRRSGNSGSVKTDHELTMQELRIIPVMNDLLAFVLMLEARLITRRRTLPLGSSLVVIATKGEPCPNG